MSPLQYSILKLFMNVKQFLTWSYSQDDIDDDAINDDDQDDGGRHERVGRKMDNMNLTMLMVIVKIN